MIIKIVITETPANLHAVDKGDTTISFVWDKVDTATMYEVQVFLMIEFIQILQINLTVQT